MEVIYTMINSIIKTNSVVVSYDILSSEAILQKKRQVFNLIAYDATDADFYEVGKAIGNMLASSPKEILKNITALLVEV